MTEEDEEVSEPPLDELEKWRSNQFIEARPKGFKALWTPPLWPELNTLGQSKLLKNSWIWLLLVPISAKALEKVDEFRVPMLGPDFVINATLPFSWQLLFFSSVAFFLANIVYLLKCPKIIQRYDRMSEMQTDIESDEACDARIPDYFWQAIEELYGDNVSALNTLVYDYQNKYGGNDIGEHLRVVEEPQGVHQLRTTGFVLHDDKFTQAFRKAYGHSEHLRPYWRRLYYFFLIIGCLFLAIIGIENFWYVLRQTGMVDVMVSFYIANTTT